jgi:hypothetical protein
MLKIEQLYNTVTDAEKYGHTDIFAHLPRLTELVNRVITLTGGTCKIVELGIGNGDQSTVAWLYGLRNIGPGGELHCYGMYEPGSYKELQSCAAETNTQLTLKVGDLKQETKSVASDILFVDSYHEREHILHELKVFAEHASCYIVFHDTVSFGRVGQDQNAAGTGVLDAVEHFLTQQTDWAWDVHYYDYNGLAILKRKTPSAVTPSVKSAGPPRVKSISNPNAAVGVVIGTFAAVPYVHLSLAALRANEPDIKILVHDDFSPAAARLKELCATYGAEYFSLDYRRKPTVGDLAATAASCRWAHQNGCDIGVKLSRRYIINKPFVASLRELFYNMQMPTVTGACGTFGFGYRSECVAMWTPAWIDCGVIDEMEAIVARNVEYSGLPEGWYHVQARKVYEMTRPPARERFDRFYALPESRAGFTDWPLMGLGRAETVPGVLWHDSHGAKDYWELAQEFNLPYTLQEFADPNMGYGDRPK